MALLCESCIYIKNIQFFGGVQITIKMFASHVKSSWVLFLVAHNNSVNELDVIAVCACVCPQNGAGKSCLNLFAADVLWNMIIEILAW